MLSRGTNPHARLSLEEFRAEFCLPFTRFYDKHTPHVPLPQLESWFHSEFKQAQDSVCELPHARQFLEFCRERGADGVSSISMFEKQGAAMLSAIIQADGFVAVAEDVEHVRPGDLVDFIPQESLLA